MDGINQRFITWHMGGMQKGGPNQQSEQEIRQFGRRNDPEGQDGGAGVASGSGAGTSTDGGTVAAA